MYCTVRSRLNALVAAEGATLTAGRTILAAIVQCVSTGRPVRAKESLDVYMAVALRRRGGRGSKRQAESRGSFLT